MEAIETCCPKLMKLVMKKNDIDEETEELLVKMGYILSIGEMLIP